MNSEIFMFEAKIFPEEKVESERLKTDLPTMRKEERGEGNGRKLILLSFSHFNTGECDKTQP